MKFNQPIQNQMTSDTSTKSNQWKSGSVQISRLRLAKSSLIDVHCYERYPVWYNVKRFFYYANCNWRGDAKLQSVLFIQFKCNFVVVVVFSFVKLHNCLSFFSLFMTLFGRRIVVVWNYLSMWHVREKQYQFDILSTFSICIAIEIRRKLLFGIYMYEIHRNSRDSV